MQKKSNAKKNMSLEKPNTSLETQNSTVDSLINIL